MGEWTSYRLQDFLLFAPRTYHRLFELHNTALWPLHPLLLTLGVLAVVLVIMGARSAEPAWRRRGAPLALLLFAVMWAGVGIGFHWHRYADINWAARWFGAAFIGQALLLVAAAAAWWFAAPAASGIQASRSGARLTAGAVMVLAALLVTPWLGLLEGRSWRAAQWFGAAPDPTVLATLGLLLMLPGRHLTAPLRWLLRLCWPIPLLWCAISGATLVAMDAATAPLLPLTALFALTLAWLRR